MNGEWRGRGVGMGNFVSVCVFFVFDRYFWREKEKDCNLGGYSGRLGGLKNEVIK